MSNYISQHIRALHALRFSDREIADRLNDPLLHKLHRRTVAELDDATKLDGQWTKDDVRNLRRKLQLPGHRPPRKLYDDHQNLWQIRAWRRAAYASRWHHHNTNDRLSPRMVDILDALNDYGPQTKAQLAQRCRWTTRQEPRIRSGGTVLCRLVSFGLVMVSLGARYHIYSLSPGIKPYISDTHPNHMTSVEARHKTREERVHERYYRIVEQLGW